VAVDGASSFGAFFLEGTFAPKKRVLRVKDRPFFGVIIGNSMGC